MFENDIVMQKSQKYISLDGSLKSFSRTSGFKPYLKKLTISRKWFLEFSGNLYFVILSKSTLIGSFFSKSYKVSRLILK